MNLLQVLIPSDNIEERSYIIDVIIKEFLGLSYELIIKPECQDYVLTWERKTIIIKDSFFSNYKESLSYLTPKSLPETLLWFTQLDEKIPIIYGDNILRIEENEVFFGIDIFGSSFFMLSRWEEYVMKQKDVFGRCNESEMFVVKNKLLNHPLVCEYCLILKKMLLLLCPGLVFKTRIYSPFITHDVDFLFRYGSLFSLVQNLSGDIIHRKSPGIAKSTILNYLRYKKGIIKDPFDTFDELMNLSEEYGFKSSFYFKPSVHGEPDCSYDIFDKRVVEIIKKIYTRGHEVGIHPSKNTFHNEEQYYIEVQRIRSIGIPIYGGRQHYLLYDLPETLRFWEKADMDYDCGLGFSGNIGFRCGVCRPFTVFDIIQRKTLNLVEKPLCVMESAVLSSSPEPETLFENIKIILDQVKKHSGQFVFLWHNDGLYRPENIRYKEVYLKVLKSL